MYSTEEPVDDEFTYVWMYLTTATEEGSMSRWRFWRSTNTPQLDRRTFISIHPNPADARILIWLVAQIQSHK